MQFNNYVIEISKINEFSSYEKEEYDLIKRWVFKFRLKVSTDSECLMVFGRSFHNQGPATGKDLSP